MYLEMDLYEYNISYFSISYLNILYEPIIKYLLINWKMNVYRDCELKDWNVLRVQNSFKKNRTEFID